MILSTSAWSLAYLILWRKGTPSPRPALSTFCWVDTPNKSIIKTPNEFLSPDLKVYISPINNLTWKQMRSKKNKHALKLFALTLNGQEQISYWKKFDSKSISLVSDFNVFTKSMWYCLIRNGETLKLESYLFLDHL